MRVWRVIFGAAAMGVGLLYGFTAEVPATTATAPATTQAAWNQLECGRGKAAFDFWQDEKKISPDAKGIIHLKAATFTIHVTGDVDNVFLLPSPKDDFADTMKNDKKRLVVMEATGAAYGEGNLLIQTGAGVSVWDDAKKWIFGDDVAGEKESAAALKEELGAMPMLLATPVQFVATYAPDGANTYRFKVSKALMCDGQLWDAHNSPVKEQALETLKHIMVAICLRSPSKVKLFFRFDFRAVAVEFDAK